MLYKESMTLNMTRKIDPRAVDLGTAAEALSISAAKLRTEIIDGKIRAIHIGQRVLVPVAAIDEYIELLSAEALNRARAIDE